MKKKRVVVQIHRVLGKSEHPQQSRQLWEPESTLNLLEPFLFLLLNHGG